MNQIRPKQTTWTPAREQWLRDAVAEGILTRAQMARELSVTRNQLAGKIHRLGLCDPAKNPKGKTRRDGAANAVTKKSREKALGESGGESKTARRRAPSPPEPVGPKVQNGCRFIEGEPGDIHTMGEGIYCNRPKEPGSDWCAAHHARVYLPVHKARKDRQDAQNLDFPEGNTAPNWNTRHRPGGNGPKRTRRKVGVLA